MDDTQLKQLIVEKRWRIWYNPSGMTIYKWIVQRQTWYGRWKTIGKFWTSNEAAEAKIVLMREDVLTFTGSLSEL